MVRIGMASCKLDVEGAKVVAEMVAISHSLTAADLRCNALNDDDEQLLRECVKGREGFDLKL